MIRALVVLLIFSLVACGSFPVNPELKDFDPNKGYRFKDLKLSEKNTDSLFVIVALSGGGTRAASLSYGAMKALENTKIEWEDKSKSLLDEVDIISSVSGGSLTAAYYALWRKRMFSGDFEANILKRDIQSELVKQLFVPTNWLKLLGRSYGRSDLAADFYNRELFNDARYSAIPMEKPFVILNSTDMSTGARFSFTQDQFDSICSNLSQLRVARAFASSSAFPGLLTPLTYMNRSGSCNFTDHPWVANAINDRRVNTLRTVEAENRLSYYDPQRERRDYLHLVDGGVADNIGLREPYFAISSTDPPYSILQQINNGIIKKLVVIVVNAAVAPDTGRDKTAKVPNVIDNAITAATVPLANYSVDTVELFKKFIGEFNAGTGLYEDCNAILENTCNVTLQIPKPKSVDLYLSEIDFNYIEDPKKRREFQNIPTKFRLPSNTVDDLINIGCQLLIDDPDYKKLLSGDAGFTGTVVNGLAPNCNS